MDRLLLPIKEAATYLKANGVARGYSKNSIRKKIEQGELRKRRHYVCTGNATRRCILINVANVMEDLGL